MPLGSCTKRLFVMNQRRDLEKKRLFCLAQRHCPRTNPLFSLEKRHGAHEMRLRSWKTPDFSSNGCRFSMVFPL
jgi:hypothetical protein